MYVTDCTQLPGALFDKLYTSIIPKCNVQIHLLQTQPTADRINWGFFRISSYTHRIEHFFLVYYIHGESRIRFPEYKQPRFWEKKVKFPALPKVISVDRWISNRKEFQSIFPHTGGQLIEEVCENFLALPDITFTKQEFSLRERFSYHSHSPFSPTPLLMIQALALNFWRANAKSIFHEKLLLPVALHQWKETFQATSKGVSR